MRKSMIVVAIAVSAIFAGCTDLKYKPVGPPEFNVVIQFESTTTVSPEKSATTWMVKGLTINLHTIEIAPFVTSSESRFEVETEKYGTIQFSVEGSGMTDFLQLRLTKEQQESILALGSPTGEIRSIAVLPLVNISGDPEQEPFADRVTEMLISGLTDVGTFDKVAPFTSVMTHKESYDLPEIARDLGVDAVLEGSVRRMESRVRLTVQLIYVPTDLHWDVWSGIYDRDLEDLGGVVREVATGVSDIDSELVWSKRD